MGNRIVIDPEFRALIPPLRPEERAQLEANLIAEGCRDPLVIWKEKQILLDGHNRHEICTAKGVEFQTREISLESREAAEDWIDSNQLGRRNLTPDQYSLLRGRRYNRVKKQGERTDRTSGQNVHKSESTTSMTLAKQYGVNEKTIRRDGEFAAAVEKVKQVDPTIESKVVQGNAPARGLITEAAKQIEKAERVEKEEKAAPLIFSRKDRQAAEVLEKAKDKAAAILSGKMGTIAQAKRKIVDTEKMEALNAQAAVAPPSSDWKVVDGSCVEVLPTLEPKSARLIFADPPYNIGWDYGDDGHNDSMPATKYLAFCRSFIETSVPVLTDDGSMWILINHEWAARIELLLVDAGLTIRNWITWYESFGVNCSKKFNRCSRRLFHAVKDPNRFVFHPEAVTRESERQRIGDKRANPGGKLWDDVWGIDPPIPRLTGTCKERIPDASNQLPLALLKPIIGCASDPGDLVIDPFCGSGSTGDAAIRLGRRFIGIEKVSRYAELSRTRLASVKGELIGVAI